jgi:hypothetical protein
MSEFVGRVQDQFKKTSGDVALFSAKLFSGLVLGLTFGLVMQEMLGYGDDENLLAFFFVIIVTASAFMRIVKSWSFVTLLVFNLICVLVGMIMRLYVMVAPGL